MALINYQTFLNTNNIYTGYDVNSGGGNSYVWGYNATNQYGVQSEAKGITFPSAIKTTLSSNIQNWISIIFLVILVSMFSPRNVELGAVVVPIFANILVLFGWLQVSPILTASCLILGVLYYMRRQEIKVAT
jgi:ribosomal protein L30E